MSDQNPQANGTGDDQADKTAGGTEVNGVAEANGVAAQPQTVQVEAESGTLTANEAEILKKLKKEPWNIPGIATQFSISEEEAVHAIDALVRKGYDIQYDRRTKRVNLVLDPVTLEPLRVDPDK